METRQFWKEGHSDGNSIWRFVFRIINGPLVGRRMRDRVIIGCTPRLCEINLRKFLFSLSLSLYASLSFSVPPSLSLYRVPLPLYRGYFGGPWSHYFSVSYYHRKTWTHHKKLGISNLPSPQSVDILRPHFRGWSNTTRIRSWERCKMTFKEGCSLV